MNESLKRYLWKQKIDVTQFCDGDQHTITMREPNIAEFKEICKIQKLLESDDKTGAAVMEALSMFCEQACTLIVDHDFYTDDAEPKKLASKEVAEFISSKLQVAQLVLKEYLLNLPLARQTGNA